MKLNVDIHGPFHYSAPSAISITAPSEYQTDLDAGMRPKVCLVGAVATSYKDTTEEQGPQGMGGCPRLIVCLLFEDEDDNHGDDDDRRNLSPSGLQSSSLRQRAMAGDCGDGLRGSFPHFRWRARAEGMSFVCIFSTLCRVEAYISFLIFKSTPPLLPYCGRMVDGGGRLGVGFAS